MRGSNTKRLLIYSGYKGSASRVPCTPEGRAVRDEIKRRYYEMFPEAKKIQSRLRGISATAFFIDDASTTPSKPEAGFDPLRKDQTC